MILIKCKGGCIRIPDDKCFTIWASGQRRICISADNMTFEMDVEDNAYQWADDISETISDAAKLEKSSNIIIDLSKFVPKRMRNKASSSVDSSSFAVSPFAVSTKTLDKQKPQSLTGSAFAIKIGTNYMFSPVGKMTRDNLTQRKENIIVDLAKIVPKQSSINTSVLQDSRHLNDTPIAIYARTLNDHETA